MIDADQFRQTMRQLAAGVSVITAGQGTRVHGMTATSVTSLSKEPPLLLVCIHRDNETHRLLSRGSHFGVNMLGAAQQGLSDRFAGKDAARYHFDDVPHQLGPAGTLLFKDCAAIIEAEVSDVFAGGDHSIFVGRILWASVDPETAPLVYCRGSYQHLASLPLPAWPTSAPAVP